MIQETTKKRNPIYLWTPLLFGLVFILIGIWILKSPVESYEKITKLIGVIILISGTTQLIFTLSNRKGIPGWGFQLSGDLFDLAIGIILIVNPSILLRVITLFVGIWIIANSIAILMKAGQARKGGHRYWAWEFALGIFLMLLAGIFLWHPLVLGVSIAIWTAMAFITLGIFRIVLAFRLRKLRVGQSV
jgi:uncharacterized membrane protein HdeD (DUF308 family)